MKKILFFTFFLIIAVIAVAVLYFSNLSKGSRQNDKALSYIPSDAALVASFRYGASFNDIFRNYEVFDAVTGEEKATEINQLQQIILHHTAINAAVNEQTFFLSFHATPTSVNLLWLTTLNGKVNEQKIFKALSEDSQNLKVQKKLFNGYSGYQIILKPINKAFYLYLDDEIILGSFSEQLLQSCLSSKTPKIDRQFIAEINATGQKNINSPVNLFINHNTFPKFLSAFFQKKPTKTLELVKDLNGFATLNMNFKSDALMFNGISLPDSSIKNYLNIFLHQKPINNTVKNIVPISTANFLAFGISDNAKFHAGLRVLFNQRKELNQLESQIQRIAKETGIDLEKDVKNLWGKEFALIELASQEKLAIVQVTDGSRLNFFLDPISTEAAGPVRRFNNSNILYYYFGDPVKDFSRPFFAVVDNYLIAANTIFTVQQYLNSYNAEKFLSKESDFVKFNQLVANQSNIMFFVHIKNSEKIVKNKINRSFSKVFEDDKFGLKNFYGASYQLSADGDHFLTNLYADYIPAATKLNKPEWKYGMQGQIAFAPQVFIDEQNKSFILVQDRINNLYALTPDGEKIWSWQLDGKILGNIQQLNDRSLVFNTSDRLYHINPSGIPFNQFPADLPVRASYGLTLSGTDPQNLKIFIPCHNVIHAFDGAGNAISGWNKELDGNILFDLKTAYLNNISYVIAGTESGKFYFFNQNGNLAGRVAVTETFSNPLFLEMKSEPADSRILTTNTDGVLRSIFFDGKTSKKNIGIWSPEHFFDIKNITGDVIPEYIFLDKNQLYVYQGDNSLVFNYEFPYAISNRPQFFPVNSSFYQLGIASSEDNLLYLFNEDGTLAKGFPFKGLPYFYIGSIKSDGKTYLICGEKDNYLYAYKL